MNGTIIPHTPIAVDFWKVRKCPSAKLFFLTHMHADHTVGLTSVWTRPLYCSPITGKLVKHKFKLKENLVHTLEVGEAHTVFLDDSHTELMTVTPLDANHCPGSVMYLFQGYFGTILYTGDFRYSSSMFEAGPLSRQPHIDVLYLDNTYCCPGLVLPTREQATALIIHLIEHHPQSRVLIVLRQLGKEDLLVKLAQHFKTHINVESWRYTLYELLELPPVFKQDGLVRRITTIDTNKFNTKLLERLNMEGRTIAIIPTALYTIMEQTARTKDPNVHVVAYSDHSSFPELKEFVSRIQPGKVIPVVNDKHREGQVSNMSGISHLTSHMQNHTQTRPIKIPESVRAFIENRSSSARKHSSLTRMRAVHHRKPLFPANFRVREQKARGVQFDGGLRENYLHGDDIDSHTEDSDVAIETVSTTQTQDNSESDNKGFPVIEIVPLNEVQSSDGEECMVKRNNNPMDEKEWPSQKERVTEIKDETDPTLHQDSSSTVDAQPGPTSSESVQYGDLVFVKNEVKTETSSGDGVMNSPPHQAFQIHNSFSVAQIKLEPPEIVQNESEAERNIPPTVCTMANSSVFNEHNADNSGECDQFEGMPSTDGQPDSINPNISANVQVESQKFQPTILNISSLHKNPGEAAKLRKKKQWKGHEKRPSKKVKYLWPNTLSTFGVSSSSKEALSCESRFKKRKRKSATFVPLNPGKKKKLSPNQDQRQIYSSEQDDSVYNFSIHEHNHNFLKALDKTANVHSTVSKMSLSREDKTTPKKRKIPTREAPNGEVSSDCLRLSRPKIHRRQEMKKRLNGYRRSHSQNGLVTINGQNTKAGDQNTRDNRVIPLPETERARICENHGFGMSQFRPRSIFVHNKCCQTNAFAIQQSEQPRSAVVTDKICQTDINENENLVKVVLSEDRTCQTNALDHDDKNSQTNILVTEDRNCQTDEIGSLVKAIDKDCQTSTWAIEDKNCQTNTVVNEDKNCQTNSLDNEDKTCQTNPLVNEDQICQTDPIVDPLLDLGSEDKNCETSEGTIVTEDKNCQTDSQDCLVEVLTSKNQACEAIQTGNNMVSVVNGVTDLQTDSTAHKVTSLMTRTKTRFASENSQTGPYGSDESNYINEDRHGQPDSNGEIVTGPYVIGEDKHCETDPAEEADRTDRNSHVEHTEVIPKSLLHTGKRPKQNTSENENKTMSNEDNPCEINPVDKSLLGILLSEGLDELAGRTLTLTGESLLELRDFILSSQSLLTHNPADTAESDEREDMSLHEFVLGKPTKTRFSASQNLHQLESYREAHQATKRPYGLDLQDANQNLTCCKIHCTKVCCPSQNEVKRKCTNSKAIGKINNQKDYSVTGSPKRSSDVPPYHSKEQGAVSPAEFCDEVTMEEESAMHCMKARDTAGNSVLVLSLHMNSTAESDMESVSDIFADTSKMSNRNVSHVGNARKYMSEVRDREDKEMNKSRCLKITSSGKSTRTTPRSLKEMSSQDKRQSHIGDRSLSFDDKLNNTDKICQNDSSLQQNSACDNGHNASKLSGLLGVDKQPCQSDTPVDKETSSPETQNKSAIHSGEHWESQNQEQMSGIAKKLTNSLKNDPKLSKIGHDRADVHDYDINSARLVNTSLQSRKEIQQNTNQTAVVSGTARQCTEMSEENNRSTERVQSEHKDKKSKQHSLVLHDLTKNTQSRHVKENIGKKPSEECLPGLSTPRKVSPKANKGFTKPPFESNVASLLENAGLSVCMSMSGTKITPIGHPVSPTYKQHKKARSQGKTGACAMSSGKSSTVSSLDLPIIHTSGTDYSPRIPIISSVNRRGLKHRTGSLSHDQEPSVDLGAMSWDDDSLSSFSGRLSFQKSSKTKKTVSSSVSEKPMYLAKEVENCNGKQLASGSGCYEPLPRSHAVLSEASMHLMTSEESNTDEEVENIPLRRLASSHLRVNKDILHSDNVPNKMPCESCDVLKQDVASRGQSPTSTTPGLELLIFEESLKSISAKSSPESRFELNRPQANLSVLPKGRRPGLDGRTHKKKNE